MDNQLLHDGGSSEHMESGGVCDVGEGARFRLCAADRPWIRSWFYSEGGAEEVKETLAGRDLYLSCIGRTLQSARRRRRGPRGGIGATAAGDSDLAAVDCPVVICGSGAPVRNGQFYGMYSSPPRGTPLTARTSSWIGTGICPGGARRRGERHPARRLHRSGVAANRTPHP